ncbi:MAG: ComEA family DNA-binding protein [bacterium]|nr:ComEA family DNA-binding protein [Candidatus Kapabacteria bacterium]
MSIITKLESAFGATRGDVTIALFIASAALFGFFYLTFIDDRVPEHERLELLRLQQRYDSVVSARERAPLARFERDLAKDSLPTLQAVLSEPASTESRSARSSDLPTSPVNLNTAATADLVRLPGVGDKTAAAIVERRKHIPFRRAEDLMEVKGIGEKKFAKIKPYVKVK